MTRRNFFTMLSAALAGFKPAAKAEPTVAITEQIHLDLNHAAPVPTLGGVTWGPGLQHPNWRVPQGRWTLDDPDKALEWTTPPETTGKPWLANSPWLELKTGQLNRHRRRPE